MPSATPTTKNGSRPPVRPSGKKRPPVRPSGKRRPPAKVAEDSTPEEQHRVHEDVVRKGFANFIEVGNSLKWIHDNETYKTVDKYKTFKDYCRQKWDMVASRGRQLISAAEVSKNLTDVTVVTPMNECQVRPLMGLALEQQRDAWQRAVEEAGGKLPTGRMVAQVVKELKEETDEAPQDSDQECTSLAETPAGKLERMTTQLSKHGKKVILTLTAIEDIFEEHDHVEGLGPLAEVLQPLHERVELLMRKVGSRKVTDSGQGEQLSLPSQEPDEQLTA